MPIPHRPSEPLPLKVLMPRFALLSLALAPALFAQSKPEATSLLGKSLFSEPDTEGRIAKADAALAANPKDLDLILAAGLARDAVRQYNASIAVYSKGLEIKADDARLLRARGNRYISIRKFDPAVADLEKARSIAPSAFEVSYYLGMALYLKGSFNDSANEFARCVNMVGKPDEFAKSLPKGMRSCADLVKYPDFLMPLADWHYRALRRAGRHGEAKEIIERLKPGMNLQQNKSNYDALMVYKGLSKDATALEGATGVSFVNLASGIGLYQVLEGKASSGCGLLRKAASDPNWPAFGVIAAEAELTKHAKAACALFTK